MYVLYLVNMLKRVLLSELFLPALPVQVCVQSLLEPAYKNKSFDLTTLPPGKMEMGSWQLQVLFFLIQPDGQTLVISEQEVKFQSAQQYRKLSQSKGRKF